MWKIPHSGLDILYDCIITLYNCDVLGRRDGLQVLVSAGPQIKLLARSGLHDGQTDQYEAAEETNNTSRGRYEYNVSSVLQ